MADIPTEEQVAAAKAAHQRKQEKGSGGNSSGPGSLPSWKLTRGTQVYQLGGLRLALRPLARRPASIAYQTMFNLPPLLQVAAQCGLEEAGRLDFERASEILSALTGEEISPDLAAGKWRDFVVSEEMADAVGILADVLLLFLDDPLAQGYAWPRPKLPLRGDDQELEDWEAEAEKIVAEALPPGCRWLDDAIEEELHELEIPFLLTILFDVQGGFPGDVRERFTQP